MSFKSIACMAAIAALTATTAQAQSIRVELATNGTGVQLDSNGDYVWNVYFTADANGGASSVELGAVFSGDSADGNFVYLQDGSVTVTGLDGGDVEYATAGRPVFGWEDTSSGSFTAPGAGDNGVPSPIGLHLGMDSSTPVDNEAFAAFGTGILGNSEEILFATFTTTGPSTSGALQTALDIIGAYDMNGDPVASPVGTHGIAGPLTGANPDGEVVALTTSGSYTALAGDSDLNGTVDTADLVLLDAGFGSGTIWHEGDFDGDGDTTTADLVILDGNFGAGPAPAFVGGGGGVPEPAGVLLALAALPALLRRR